jgi:hypothetical protein
MKLNLKAFALTCGLVWGGAVCFTTLWLLAFGYGGTVIRHLDHFYFGYSFSVVGAFIGLVYGFIDGAIGGAIFAWLYNLLVPKTQS